MKKELIINYKQEAMYVYLLYYCTYPCTKINSMLFSKFEAMYVFESLKLNCVDTTGLIRTPVIN